MLENCVEIIREGDVLGNHMIFRLRLPSGRDVFAFGTETLAKGEDSLGPTWCYFVSDEPSFLFDCGWRNLGGKKILKMMEAVGFSAADLDGIIISHAHEDHDGGLAELVAATGVPVRSHPAHALLSRFYPDKAPPDHRSSFPASCWNCMMPVSHSEKFCRDYHRERAELQIESIEGCRWDGLSVIHVPGHSPDGIAITIGDEAILTGDTILPEITPHPTRESIFRRTGFVMAPLGMRADQLYGIKAYIRSLKKLRAIGNRCPEMLVLPAHRLFHHGRWNETTLKKRSEELLRHHYERCASFLETLRDGPKSAREIAIANFEPRLLTGNGIFLAINEVICHFELLTSCGDAIAQEDRYAATGTMHYEAVINAIEP